jgi:hypothetical protein
MRPLLISGDRAGFPPECDVHPRDPQWPLHVDTSRLLRANSGRSVTAYRIGQLDPNRPMSMRAPRLTNSTCLKTTQKLRLFHRELLLGQNVFLAQLREALNRLYDVLSRD